MTIIIKLQLTSARSQRAISVEMNKESRMSRKWISKQNIKRNFFVLSVFTSQYLVQCLDFGMISSFSTFFLIIQFHIFFYQFIVISCILSHMLFFLLYRTTSSSHENNVAHLKVAVSYVLCGCDTDQILWYLIVSNSSTVLICIHR